MVTAEQIIDYVGRVAKRYRPKRIILFGSYAYGEPTADSDVDVLVVVSRCTNALERIVRMRCDVPVGFPLDLIVRSESDLTQRISQNDFFLSEIMTRGIVLHAADHPRVGGEGRRRLRSRLHAAAVA